MSDSTLRLLGGWVEVARFVDLDDLVRRWPAGEPAVREAIREALTRWALS